MPKPGGKPTAASIAMALSKPLQPPSGPMAMAPSAAQGAIRTTTIQTARMAPAVSSDATQIVTHDSAPGALVG